MKTLGLFYFALGKGGIERGASFQIPLFASLGWRVVVFTNRPSASSDYATQADFEHVCLGEFDGDVVRRRRRVAEELRAHGVTFVIHHDAYVPALLEADLLGARDAGAKAVVFWHSVFSHFLLRRGRQQETRDLWEACRLAESVVTLTRTDATFFRMYGVPAVSIPYADPDLMDGFERRDWPKRVVWMGRFVELKQPDMALRIFERVLARHPDAELVLLGDGENEGALRDYVSARPALARAVRFAGFRNDVRPYLEQAGVGLVTSRFEGYCHAVVEMKMASLPVVAFDMPWLDTLKNGSGAVTVPQGDVAGAADAVCRLLDDASECQRQGLLSRSSFREITSTDQPAAYAELFRRVTSGDLAVWRIPEADLEPLVLKTLVAHVEESLRLAEESRDEVWRQDRSYRLGRLVTWPCRALKRLLATR